MWGAHIIYYCYDDLLSKNIRELTLEFDSSSIELGDGKEQEILTVNNDSIDDIDIEAIEAKVLKKPKQAFKQSKFLFKKITK